MFRSSFSPSRFNTAQIAIAFAIALSCAILATASAATLSVGIGKAFPTPCSAFASAVDGDTVEIDGSSGAYIGDVCGIYANKLTIRGVNGRPKIDAGGLNAMGKGTWVVIGTGTVIDNVEMFGAKVTDKNGAAIRLDGRDLTLRNSFIHDNEDGILTSNDGVSNIVIEFTEFGHNGYGDGFSHNLYVGHVNSLVFRGNYSHDANVGHDLKSRAEKNTISYNRFSSTPPSQTGSTASGQPSYEIDLPNAGTSYVIGNVIEQPAVNQNPAMLAYGEEGASNAGKNLYVVNNTFLNDNTSSGTFVFVGSTVTTPVLLQNNIFAGVGTVSTQASSVNKTNYSALNPAFVDRTNYDLHPASGSPMIDAGSAPGTAADGTALTPASQYKHVAGIEARPIAGNIDIGAYEAASTTGGTTTTTTTTTTGNTSSTTAGTTSTTANTTTTTPGNTTTTTASTTTTTAATSPDTIPPVVSFGSPANGATVFGHVAVSVTATDDRAVARITLRIDGRQVAGTANSTLNYSWNATRVRGSHTLTATAYDTSNNQASASVTVRVTR
ncbi:MAG TPA: Ig-like domain-containing protein [Burkholderiaceae bacterium]|jgi:hypothetical protein